jgi:hypothetical protein
MIRATNDNLPKDFFVRAKLGDALLAFARATTREDKVLVSYWHLQALEPCDLEPELGKELAALKEDMRSALESFEAAKEEEISESDFDALRERVCGFALRVMKAA